MPHLYPTAPEVDLLPLQLQSIIFLLGPTDSLWPMQYLVFVMHEALICAPKLCVLLHWLRSTLSQHIPIGSAEPNAYLTGLVSQFWPKVLRSCALTTQPISTDPL